MVCVNAPRFDKVTAFMYCIAQFVALCLVAQLSQVKETHEEDIIIIIVVIDDIVTWCDCNISGASSRW